MLDITNDLGVPVFAAISYNVKEGSPDDIIYAFGAHLEAGIAVERAVVEANQLLTLGVKVDGEYPTPDPVFIDWLTHRKIKGRGLFKSTAGSAEKTCKRIYEQLCEPNIYNSLEFLIKRVEAEGMETLVLDLTQPDIWSACCSRGWCPDFAIFGGKPLLEDYLMCL